MTANPAPTHCLQTFSLDIEHQSEHEPVSAAKVGDALPSWHSVILRSGGHVDPSLGIERHAVLAPHLWTAVHRHVVEDNLLT